MDKAKYAGMWIKTETGEYVTVSSFIFHNQSKEIVYNLDRLRIKESKIDENVKTGLWEIFTSEELRKG